MKEIKSKAYREKKKPPQSEFSGTVFEKAILDLVKKYRFGLEFKSGTIGTVIPDFINRKRKLIIEIYNPDRSTREVEQRVRIFTVHGYRILHIPRDYFIHRDNERICTGTIRGFLSQ